jgi:hypothetical protein
MAALFAAALFFVGQAVAGEHEGDHPKKKKVPTVVGTVAVTKDGDAIKSITITSTKKNDTTAYSVVLDDNGKKVKATGTIAEKDGTKSITIATCEEYVPKPKKEEHAK